MRRQRLATPARLASLALAAAACVIATDSGHASASPSAVPHIDHVVVVVLENHSFQQALTMPYLMSLASTGAILEDSHGVTHPSQPNYLALWAGGTFGVTGNICPPPGSPYATENLGHACEAAGVTWGAYSENLPFAGSDTCDTVGFLYARKHEPWTHFSNLTHLNERPFEDLAVAESLGTLPALSFVIPNACHDAHDCPLAVADLWLSQYVPRMLQSVGPNGIVVVTFDEDDNLSGNRIFTTFVGGPVKAGYASLYPTSHYTILRTLCDALGLAPFGLAAAESALTDIWQTEFSGVGRDRGPGGGRRENPALTWLAAPAPNPSTGAVTAAVRLAGPAHVIATVCDLAGRRVRTLAEGDLRGDISLVWDGRREDGRHAPRGVYVLRVEAGSAALERRVTRL